jgi:hypothetical protein
MSEKKVDISQFQFRKGFENVLTEIKEERIPWNKEGLKKELGDANKLKKKTRDPNHMGRFAVLSYLYSHFEEFTSRNDGIEKALVKLKEDHERKT